MPSPDDFRQKTTTQLLRAISDLMKLYSFPATHLEELKQQVESFLEAATTDAEYITLAKWLFAWPMAALFGEVMDPKPAHMRALGVTLPFSGRLHSWFRAHMRRTPENAQLWFSWFQLKRAAPPVPDSFVKDALTKHRVAMNTPGSVLSDIELDCLLAPVKEALIGARSALEREWEKAEVPPPTRNASFERSRKEGGAAAYLSEEYHLSEVADPRGPSDHQVKDVLHSGMIHPGASVVVAEAYPPELDREALLRRTAARDLERYEQLYGAMPAKVEVVLEPLKVRTITKGPAAVYGLARKFQSVIWRHLKDQAATVLTGRSVEEEDIRDIHLPDHLAGDAWWHSIDYSAATDRLSSQISHAVLVQILPYGSDPLYERVVEASLGSHLVSYPKEFDIEPVVQKNGQLMGSVVSFPLLCLVNLATIRAADREVYPDEGPLPVLVNGDDVIVHRSREWRKVHERISQMAGLTYSVGKAYSAKNYANMNSMGFWVEGGRVKKLPYCPIGQMMGMTKVNPDDLSGLAIADAVVKEVLGRSIAFGFKPCATLALACTHLKTRGITTWRNAFLPSALGGLGLLPPRGWKWAVSERQWEHANALIAANGMACLQVRPLRGPQYESLGLDMLIDSWGNRLWYDRNNFWRTPKEPEAARPLRARWIAVSEKWLHRHGGHPFVWAQKGAAPRIPPRKDLALWPEGILGLDLF